MSQTEWIHSSDLSDFPSFRTFCTASCFLQTFRTLSNAKSFQTHQKSQAETLMISYHMQCFNLRWWSSNKKKGVLLWISIFNEVLHTDTECVVYCMWWFLTGWKYFGSFN